MGAEEESERIRDAAYGGVVFTLSEVTVARSPLTHLPFIPFELCRGFGVFMTAV